MPMNPAALESAMKTRVYDYLEANVKTKIPWGDMSAEEQAKIEAGWDDIAAAVSKVATDIVNEVKNATISTTVTVTSVTGVTTGAGVSGPGTGTGTGTIA